MTNTCPECGQPTLAADTVGMCPTCYEEHVTDPDNMVTCPGCGTVFLDVTLAAYAAHGEEDNVCPYCKATWEDQG